MCAAKQRFVYEKGEEKRVCERRGRMKGEGVRDMGKGCVTKGAWDGEREMKVNGVSGRAKVCVRERQRELV